MRAPAHPSQSGASLKGVLLSLLVLALAALAFWLASERNARRWYLTPEAGKLVVKKGLMLPAGRGSIDPATPLAKLYAPVDPPPGATLPGEQVFDDRAALDQALFELLSGWARADVTGAKPENLERGLGYLERAEKLAGISQAQREELQGLRAESGYHEARMLVGRAAEELRRAREKLQMAAGSSGPRAADAAELLRSVEPMAEEARRVSRAAGRPASPEEAPAGGASPRP